MNSCSEKAPLRCGLPLLVPFFPWSVMGALALWPAVAHALFPMVSHGCPGTVACRCSCPLPIVSHDYALCLWSVTSNLILTGRCSCTFRSPGSGTAARTALAQATCCCRPAHTSTQAHARMRSPSVCSRATHSAAATRTALCQHQCAPSSAVQQQQASDCTGGACHRGRQLAHAVHAVCAQLPPQQNVLKVHAQCECSIGTAWACHTHCLPTPAQPVVCMCQTRVPHTAYAQRYALHACSMERGMCQARAKPAAHASSVQNGARNSEPHVGQSGAARAGA